MALSKGTAAKKPVPEKGDVPTGRQKPAAALQQKAGPAMQEGPAQPVPPKTAQPVPAVVPAVPPAPAASPAKAPAAEPEKESFGDYIVQPLKAWMDYARGNFKRYYLGLLKIALADFAVGIVLLLLFGLLALGISIAVGGIGVLVAGVSAGWIGLVAAVIIGLGVLMFIGWVQQTIRLTAIAFTDAEFNGKPFGILETFGQTVWKVLRYLLVNLGVGLVLAIPVIILVGVYFLGAGAVGGGSMGAGLGFAMGFLPLVIVIMVLAYAFVAGIIYCFLTQFWAYGFLLEGFGVVEALKKSVAIVKKRPLETFAFDLVLVIGSALFATPLAIYIFFYEIVGTIIRFLASLLGNLLATIAVYILLALVNGLITVVLSCIIQLFSTPNQYLFWKKVR